MIYVVSLMYLPYTINENATIFYKVYNISTCPLLEALGTWKINLESN